MSDITLIFDELDKPAVVAHLQRYKPEASWEFAQALVQNVFDQLLLKNQAMTDYLGGKPLDSDIANNETHFVFKGLMVEFHLTTGSHSVPGVTRMLSARGFAVPEGAQVLAKFFIAASSVLKEKGDTDTSENPYLAGLELVKIHHGTSGQVALAKAILSLYNSDFYWFSIGDILAPLDQHYTGVVLAMVNAYARYGETPELRQAGEYCYQNFPRLVELSNAMSNARAEVRQEWERQREEENRRLYPEDYE